MRGKLRTFIIMISAAFVSCVGSDASVSLAGQASSALLRAKSEAEKRGYVFFANRDDIVTKARKEGKLRVQNGLRETLKISTEGFEKQYPFISLHAETVRGVADAQRLLLELKAGASRDWDILRTHPDIYHQWQPHLWKVDILGMAEHGVLNIDSKMVDPQSRNVVALGSRFAAVAYNKNLVTQAQLPKSWEDMLKPEWRGRKFGMDVNPQEIAGLVPVWGLEKTLDYARRLAAQQLVLRWNPFCRRGRLGTDPSFPFWGKLRCYQISSKKGPYGRFAVYNRRASAGESYNRASNRLDSKESTCSATLA
jgi:hypothetical protein